jgi:hypothetical protein
MPYCAKASYGALDAGCWMLDAGCWKIEVKSEKQEEIIEPPNFEYPIFNF